MDPNASSKPYFQEEFHKNILRDHLIDQKQSILFVGEGNFTFSTALAAMRNGWDGITSTTFSTNIPSVEKAQLDALKAVIENRKIKKVFDREEAGNEEILDRVETIISLPSTGPVRFTQIDATKTDLNQLGSFENVWFQCPWSEEVITDSVKATTDRSVGNLVKNYILNFSKDQSVGNLLVVGMTMLSPYHQCYRLDELLGEMTDIGFVITCPSGRYKYVGFDDELIGEILCWGYRHMALPGFDIHADLFKYHRSLIFEKIENS